MSRRDVLEAFLVSEPGDLCNGCGAGAGDKPEPRWHPSPRGTHLTHDGRTAAKCRLPCQKQDCGHKDCDELRSRLSAAR